MRKYDWVWYVIKNNLKLYNKICRLKFNCSLFLIQLQICICYMVLQTSLTNNNVIQYVFVWLGIQLSNLYTCVQSESSENLIVKIFRIQIACCLYNTVIVARKIFIFQKQRYFKYKDNLDIKICIL